MLKTINLFKCKLVKDNSVQYQTHISSVQDAHDLAIKFGFADFSEEYFSMFCLNTKGQLTGFHDISHGDLNSAPVHPREVFKRALLNNAAGIILVHNHPSGDSTPSNEDIDMTTRLVEAGDLLGIQIVDHIIIGTENNYYSMKAEQIF